MAILTSLPGVEVTITVSNSALHELEDYGSRASPDSVSRYLEVQSDGIFEIKIATSLGALRGAGLDYEIFVDGNRADGFFIAPCHCADGGHEWVSKGWRLGNGHIRQYKLRAFETDDVDGIKRQTDGTKKLGLVEVKVFHVSGVTRRETIEPVSHRKGPGPQTPISEKAVKSQELSHTIAMGEPIPDGHTGTMRRVSLTLASHDPIGTFRFLYRSNEKLKNLHILARTPPPPSIEEREAASLNESDVGELQRRLKEVNEQIEVMRRIKREEQREKQGLHHSAGSSSQTEVIDLEQDGVSVKREAQDGNPRPKKAGRGSSNTHVIELD